MIQSPFVPAATRIVLIGGGRNANNLIGLFEGIGLGIDAVLDDRPGEPVLGHAVSAIDSGLAAGRAAIMTVANPVARRALDDRPALKGATWTAYCDPRAVISGHAQIGPGAFIAPFVACADVIVGRHASIMAGVVLGARARVGDYSSVLPNATIASDAVIGRGCIIGMGARIEAGVNIGDNCRVAPNALVRRDMAEGSVAMPRLRTRIFSRQRQA